MLKSKFIKEPIPELATAAYLLRRAFQAHIDGAYDDARSLFRLANDPKIMSWLLPDMDAIYKHRKVKNPPGDTHKVAVEMRDPDRNINPDIKSFVLARDGHICRYCGVPVVDKKFRVLATDLYPGEVRWPKSDLEKHSAFLALWLQYDHIEPHSHGGRSSHENVIISCAMCNYAKFDSTLLQLNLEDPRLRAPRASNWDGIEPLANYLPIIVRGARTKSTVDGSLSEVRAEECDPQNVAAATQINTPLSETHEACSANIGKFFIPGARISGGYVYTPLMDGKERWFDVRNLVSAEHGQVAGEEGVLLVCECKAFDRRKMTYPLRIE